MGLINTQTTPSAARLIAAILLLQGIASFAYPIAKYGLAIIGPFTFAFYRFCLASGALMLLTRLRRPGIRIEKKDYLRIVLLGVLIIPLNQTLFLVGQSLTSAGHGAFLFATTPIWIFILALVHLHERFRWSRLIGVTVALGGVAAIMLSGVTEVGREYFWGDAIILVSVLAWAYYTILGKPLVQKYGALRMTAYALTAGTVIYFPFGLYRAVQFDYSGVTLGAWGAIAYMAIGLSLVVYVLWYWVLKYMEASRIAVYHNIQPVIATAVSCLWLGEPLGEMFIAGGMAVIAGLLFTELAKKRSTPDNLRRRSD